MRQLARDIMSAMSVGELAEWDTTATLPDRMCAQAIRSQWETNRAKGKLLSESLLLLLPVVHTRMLCQFGKNI